MTDATSVRCEIAIGRPLVALLLMLSAACRGAPALGEPWDVHPPAVVDAQALQSPQMPREAVTLAQLTSYALANNPNTRQAWESALVDAYGIDAASALLWPVFSASVPLSVNRTAGGAAAAPQVQDAPAPASGWTRSASASLSISWVLFDFGAREYGVRAARWQAVSTALTYNRELQTVASSVEKAYFTELSAVELVHALESNLAAAQSSYDSASALHATGMATIGDLSQAKSSLASAQLQLIQARAAERSDAGTLSVAAGFPAGYDLKLAGADAMGAADALRLPSVDELLSKARESRADLRSLDAQVEQANAQREAIRAQGLPSLSFGAGGSRTWASNARPTTTQQAALTLNIPLFDGGLVRAQTSAAREKARQVAAQRDAQALTVQLDVWQAYQTARTVQDAVDAAQQALAAAAIAEESARARYRSGMATVVELLIAQSTLARARVTEIQARYDARIAYSTLGYAVGATRPIDSLEAGTIR